MYNKVILVGRLTKDPEHRTTPSGKSVASFRLAVDRSVGGGQGEREADFIDVVVWERQADLVGQYLSKGRLCLVDGRLQVRQFDGQDGTRRTFYEVVAQTVRFLPDGRGGPSAGGSYSETRSRFEPAPAGGGTGSGESFGSDFTPSEDDDVPF